MKQYKTSEIINLIKSIPNIMECTFSESEHQDFIQKASKWFLIPEKLSMVGVFYDKNNENDIPRIVLYERHVSTVFQQITDLEELTKKIESIQNSILGMFLLSVYRKLRELCENVEISADISANYVGMIIWINDNMKLSMYHVWVEKMIRVDISNDINKPNKKISIITTSDLHINDPNITNKVMDMVFDMNRTQSEIMKIQ